jgi:hypothetical protein
MGLQVTKSLLETGVVVAGPFHPAFGHLVHSAVFLDIATRELERKETASRKFALKVHPHDVSKVKGLKNYNIKKLILRFELEELEVLSDHTVLEDTVRVVEL